MIRIQVITYNGLPPSQPIAAVINDLGGNIGRADGNALTLPDPERHISRTHATIMFRAGGYIIRDLGTATPVYVNSRPLGNGQEAPITHGDEIRVGGYTMRVTNDISSMTVTPQSTPPSKETVAEMIAAPHQTAQPLDDIFAVPAARIPAGIIPSDFDPFADLTPLQPNSAPPSSATLPGNGERVFSPSALDISSPSTLDILGPSTPDQSIDKLFGLGARESSDPFPSGNPLAEPLDQPNAAASVDPLIAMGVATSRSKPASGAPQRDDVLEFRGAFRPPQAKPDTAMQANSPNAPLAASRTEASGVATIPASPETPGMVLSWERSEPGAGVGETRTAIVTSLKRERERRQGERRKVTSEDVISVAESRTRFVGEHTETSPAMKSTPPSSPITEISPRLETSVNRDELLRAFLAGAGVPDLAVPGELTPQMMSMFGQLLRESTQGTLDLLLARSLTKREVRAEMTIIAVRENNPLKFSPGVEVALAHLLSPQGRGFMKPLEAVKDAYDDLRSHQFGFMAGMRAALAGVLERFNPARLEQRLTQKTMIDSVLPMTRKAKLWDLFSARYEDISKEAEDDFNALFGKEFLRAYEAQIAKLEQDDKSITR